MKKNQKKEKMSVMSEQPVNNTIGEANPKKQSKNKIIGIAAISAGVVILGVILVIALLSLNGGKKVEDIDNLPEQIILAYEGQYQLEPVIIPEKATPQITYSIEDEKYATVDENGLITAKSEQGSTFVTVEADGLSKKIKMDIFAPVDSEALEESYKEAKSLLDIVNSDTSINQDDVAEAKTNMQQSFDILESKGIKIEDISEQGLDILSTFESIDAIKSKTQLLLDAYELAWDVVEQKQAAAKAAAAKAATKKKATKNVQASAPASTSNHSYCSVCGSTSHTKHPACVVCGSTSHSKHPVCPICASTTHTKHPQ